MLGLFAPRLPIDADEFDWILACFRWFADEFDAARRYLGAPRLVFPDADTFPPSAAAGHARAAELFETVKRRAGMIDWDCDLICGEAERGTRVSTGLGLRHIGESAPLGTFGFAHGRYWISYNPALLERPESLVATFAHELGHYLLHTARTRCPGGRDLQEHATDLAAVYLGFGLFLANGAQTFRQFEGFGEQGWEMRRQGYLSEMALTTALALFVRLTGTDARAAGAALKPALRPPFRRAVRAIDRRHPDARAALASVALSDWG
jgi:hypothetical protein